MQISDFKIFHYSLPLNKPIPGQKENVRQGFILQIKDGQGHSGYGETAPLASVSMEQTDIVLAQLRDFAQQSKKLEIPSQVSALEDGFQQLFAKIPLAPSVRFGIEMAILTLKSNQNQKLLAETLDENYQPDLEVNALLHGSPQNILQDAQDLLTAGYSTLKVKLAGMKIKEAVATVEQLTKIFNGRALLRIDANRSWSLAEALEFAKEVDYGIIEYLEDPLKNFNEIPQLYNETMMPIALDESLKSHSLKEIKSIDGIEVVILKPTLLGGFEKTKALIDEAHAYGLRVVISSTFESGVGLRGLAHLAASFSRHVAAGLDTGRWFKNDLLTPFKLEHGRLLIDQCQFSHIQLNSKLLKEV